MLANPPCIIGIVGCNGSDSSTQTSGSSSSSSFSVPHWNGYSSSFSVSPWSGSSSSFSVSPWSGRSSSTGLSISSWSGYSSRSGTSSGNSSSASGSSGSTGLFGNLFGRSSSSGGSTSSSSSSSTGTGFHFSSAASAGASALNSAKDKVATYVITAKNKTTQFLSGVKLTHGPLPQDSVFDPALSSPVCQSVSGSSQGVECTMDLGPGESKQVNVAYHVKNSLSCLLARALQTAKTTVNRITGSAADQQVQASVSCNVSAASSSGSIGAGGAGTLAGGVGSTGTVAGAGNSAGTQASAGDTAGTTGASSGGNLNGYNGTGIGGTGANGQLANSFLAGGTDYVYQSSASRGTQLLPQTGVQREYYSNQFSKLNLFSYVTSSNSDVSGLPVTSAASILLVGAIVSVVLLRAFFGISKCKT